MQEKVRKFFQGVMEDIDGSKQKIITRQDVVSKKKKDQWNTSIFDAYLKGGRSFLNFFSSLFIFSLSILVLSLGSTLKS